MGWYYWIGIIWACLAVIVIIFDRSNVNKLSYIIVAPLFLLYFILFWPALIYTPVGLPWLRHGKVLNFFKIIFAPVGILMALAFWGLYHIFIDD